MCHKKCIHMKSRSQIIDEFRTSMMKYKSNAFGPNCENKTIGCCRMYKCMETAPLLSLSCSKCKHIFYCSKQCQTKDWNHGHSKECQNIRESLPYELVNDEKSNFVVDTFIWFRKMVSKYRELNKYSRVMRLQADIFNLAYDIPYIQDGNLLFLPGILFQEVGDCAYEQGNWDNAIRLYNLSILCFNFQRQSIEVRFFNALLLVNTMYKLGLAYMKKGEYDKTSKLLLLCLNECKANSDESLKSDLDSFTKKCYLVQARCFRRLHKYASAVSSCNDLLTFTQDPAYTVDAEILIANILAVTGSLQKSVELLERLIHKYGNYYILVLLELANRYRDNKEYEKSISMFTSANSCIESIEPAKHKAILYSIDQGLGHTLAFRGGHDDLLNSIKSFELCLNIANEDSDTEIIAIMHLNLGVVTWLYALAMLATPMSTPESMQHVYHASNHLMKSLSIDQENNAHGNQDIIITANVHLAYISWLTDTKDNAFSFLKIALRKVISNYDKSCCACLTPYESLKGNESLCNGCKIVRSVFL